MNKGITLLAGGSEPDRVSFSAPSSDVPTSNLRRSLVTVGSPVWPDLDEDRLEMTSPGWELGLRLFDGRKDSDVLIWAFRASLTKRSTNRLQTMAYVK